MRIDSSGNVGIGTTSPQARLSVSDASAIGFEVAPNFTGGIVRQIAYNRSTSAFVPMRTQASQHEFYSATGEVVRIDSSGNVGIGTNAPAQRLHVVGQARIVGSVSSGRLDIFGATSATDGAFSLNSVATRSFVIRDEYSAVERMRITSAGAVYIGNGETSATPANGFLLATGGSGTDIAGAAMLIWGGRSTGSAAGGPITFSTSPAGTTGTSLNAATERMRIDSNGRVGIGTTGMSYPLDVRDATGAGINVQTTSGNAQVRINSVAGGSPRLDLVSSTGTQSIYGGVGGVNNMVFYVNSTEAMRINATGAILQANATSGSGAIVGEQTFRLAADVTAFGPTIGDFFGATSAISLEASSIYEITIYAVLTKTTAGTATWTLTASSAPTRMIGSYQATPITGIGAGAPTSGFAGSQAATTAAFAATGSLTTAVNHVYQFKVQVQTNAASSFKLQLTQSAGTATPLAGSYYTVKKVSATVGTFV
jgi:hypothetical protein